MTFLVGIQHHPYFVTAAENMNANISLFEG